MKEHWGYFLLPPSSRGVIYWSNSTSMPFKLPWDRGILGPSFWFFKRDSGFLSQVINLIRRAKVSEMRKDSAPSWFQGKPLHEMQSHETSETRCQSEWGTLLVNSRNLICHSLPGLQWNGTCASKSESEERQEEWHAFSAVPPPPLS